MLVKSGVKKNKSSSITLMILIAFAVLCMNLGMNVIGHMGSFIDEKNKSLNGADFLFLGTESCHDEAEEILKSTDGYETSESEKGVYFKVSSIYNERVEKKEQKVGMLFLNLEEERDISRVNILEAKGEINPDSIILPYSLKTGSNYEVGDKVIVKINDKDQEFHIYGFLEDVLFATPMNISVYKCLIPNTSFQKMYQDASKEEKSALSWVRLKEGTKPDIYDEDVAKAFSKTKTYDLLSSMGLNYTSMKFGVSATINIIMAIFLVFSGLIIVISIIVIRFSITTYIEEDIKNLGSLEAIGFTSRMIRNALIVQYLFIAAIGYIIGTTLSCMLTKVVSSYVAVSIGLSWNQPMTVNVALISLAIISVFILAISYRVSARIKKVTPIMALRNGIENYHFDKNYLPFETSHGGLHWILGLKGLLHNKRQNCSIGTIFIMMSFCIVIVGEMFHTFVLNESGLMKLIGLENAQLEIVDHGQDHQEFLRELEKEEGVKKTLSFGEMNLTIVAGEQKISSTVFICDDYAKTETDILAQGRQPEHDNEIAISLSNMKKLHAKIGDVVSIEYGDKKEEFIIVGALQHIQMLGLSARITVDGMRRCDAEYDENTFLVYCDEGQSTKDLKERLHDRVYQRGGTITDIKERNDTMLSSFYQGITLVCIALLIITMVVVAVILYYLVKMRIHKEKTHYGIQKAIGFTTSQLIRQTILSFTPVAAVSALTGAVIAALTTNKIMSLILNLLVQLKDAGIKVNLWMTLGGVCAMVALTIVITGLVALRIRRIDVRELVDE